MPPATRRLAAGPRTGAGRARGEPLDGASRPPASARGPRGPSSSAPPAPTAGPWAPTVQLQVLVRALPSPGWCLVESRSTEVAGGWSDEECRIWDAAGRLVAQARQLARAAR